MKSLGTARPLVAVMAAAGLVMALVTVPASPVAADAARPDCDPLVAAECLLPFPNDWYTEADRSSPTGRRVAFGRTELPRAATGPPVDPEPWNRADGFSPGSALIAHVPGLHLEATGAAPITDIGRSLDRDAPIVIIDTRTGRRWPYFAELDANAGSDDRRALLIRPARNFLDGHRYVVALRDLKDARSRTIPAPEPFAVAAGPELPAGHPLRERQRRLRPVLKTLARHGIGPEGLHLAWDFTVASTANLTRDMRTIRDDALRDLGRDVPDYEVTEVTDFTEEEDPRIAREVRGHVDLPSYLSLPGGPPGSFLNRGPDGRPRRLAGNTQRAAFRCEIPRPAFDRPSRPSLYGHGLLGSRNEVGAGNVRAMAAEHNFTFCAADWIGMASEDIPIAVGALLDMNLFPAMPERLQQGMLNAIFVGRALIHPRGFRAHEAFRTDGAGRW